MRLASIWEGVRFIRRNTLILSIVIVVLTTNMIDAAFFSVVAPAYIRQIFHISYSRE